MSRKILTRPTKGKSRETTNVPRRPSVLLYYRKFAITLVLVLLLVWFFFFKDTQRYSTSTDEVKQQFQSILGAVQLPGKQLGSDVRDQGCSDETSVGLQTRIDCSMEGYKYVAITGDKKEALSLANAKIESLGFKRDINGSYADQVLGGITEGDVSYVRGYTSVQVGWAALKTGTNNSDSSVISQGVSSHQLIPSAATKDAVIVGVTTHETYWSCSSGGLDIFGWGCAFSPHSTKAQ